MKSPMARLIGETPGSLLTEELEERGDPIGAVALELAETAHPDVILISELDLCLSLRRGEPGRTWDRNVLVRSLQW